MKRHIGWVLVLVFCGVGSVSRAQEPLDALATKAARDAIAQFKEDKLTEEQLAVSVIDLSDPANVRRGSFRGQEPIFPASVVKMFYLVATHRWLEDEKLQDSDELRRTMGDMIVDSSNDATAMIVDALTDAINGPPLPDERMKQWAEKRNSINRYFASLGYAIGGASGINVNQKTYCEGPYGREKLFIGAKYENRNKLTTDATARLLCEIVLGKAVTAERSKQMMELLERDPQAKPGSDAQATDYTAGGLPSGSKLWSKSRLDQHRAA